ncbi:hypothetical protein ABZ848_13645 [Streptomyces sp. NPDC047081]|uniref:hypothetical protein n=1 Tax=Streptomyces sp. NPDC047081 TaxID=3154706 RepID=UPI0033EFB823
MTRDDGTAQGETEAEEAATELRHALAAHLKGHPLPPDLVITTRADIERREFRAYGQGWRDRGEHDERRRTEAAAETAWSRTGHLTPTDATVLPFPYPSGPASARPHPDDEGP